MPVDFAGARHFVHDRGTLFERALFDYLFDDGSLSRLQSIILCYKNPDGGFGHGFEHDLKAPGSNPLALEYLLSVMKFARIGPGGILDGAADWTESQMDAAGNLRNPAETRHYPLAPWWRDNGGQTMPDSIAGNLLHFGCATDSLIDRTKDWVAANHSPGSIRENDWLFMAYHAFDFFFAIDDFPDIDDYRRATIENIIACAERAPDSQAYSLFAFAPTPESTIAKALPPALLSRYLDALERGQQASGNWRDQHDLPQWQPITTINALLTLRRYGRFL